MPGKIVYDHKGRKFNSVKAMLEYHKVTRSNFDARKRIGLSLEECLSPEPLNKKTVKDHKGQVYNSLKEMLDTWGVPKHIYFQRKNSGWDLERILTTPVKVVKKPDHKIEGKICTDPWGKPFISETDMCRAYGIPYKVFRDRVEVYGWSPKKALTTPVKSRLKACKDHKGIKYDSFSEMAKAYNQDEALLRNRLNQGCDLEKALTTPKKETKCAVLEPVDFNGVRYKDTTAMARVFGIDQRILVYRIKKGWDLKAALTTPTKKGSK